MCEDGKLDPIHNVLCFADFVMKRLYLDHKIDSNIVSLSESSCTIKVSILGGHAEVHFVGHDADFGVVEVDIRDYAGECVVFHSLSLNDPKFIESLLECFNSFEKAIYERYNGDSSEGVHHQIRSR